MSKAQSIRQRLLNISKKEENVNFQLIIIRYLHERLLFRLSISEFRDNFFLKGGVLIYALENDITRPTKDIDLLGQNVAGDTDTIKNIFQHICAIHDDDAVVFLSDTIDAESIKEEDKYEGVRLHIDGGFDTIKQRLQVDIGFGDVITPEPQRIHYPLLIAENSPVELKAYTVESIIAEKIHAMVVLSLTNSRMKDFYDVYHLLKSSNLNVEFLKRSINQTFLKRETTFDTDSDLLNDTLYKDEILNQRWSVFLKRNKLNHSVTFEETIIYIQEMIKPLFYDS